MKDESINEGFCERNLLFVSKNKQANSCLISLQVQCLFHLINVRQESWVTLASIVKGNPLVNNLSFFIDGNAATVGCLVASETLAHSHTVQEFTQTQERGIAELLHPSFLGKGLVS